MVAKPNLSKSEVGLFIVSFAIALLDDYRALLASIEVVMIAKGTLGVDYEAHFLPRRHCADVQLRVGGVCGVRVGVKLHAS